MPILIIFSLILVITLLLRVVPIMLSKGSSGADHWFWKAYIEKYAQEKKFPPDLPQYMLDLKQWYPPIFPLIMIRLPKLILNKYGYYIPIFIDLVRVFLLLSILSLLSKGNKSAILTSGIIYATTPILVSYNMQLNPRGLGALFLDCVIILVAGLYIFECSTWIWFIILIFAGLILLTHKMTTQLFWIICIFLGFYFHDWKLFMIIPGSVLSALLLSRGFYWKVLQAHFDIVSFWNRNWKWLQANPVKESPIYGDFNYDTQTKFYKRGAKGFLRHLSYFFGYSPALWITIVAVIPVVLLKMLETDSLISFAYAILSLTVVFAVCTVFVPFLKCLGAGYYYLYNTALLLAFLWGSIIMQNQKNPLAWLACFICLGFNLISLFLFYTKIEGEGRKDVNLDKMIAFIRTLPYGPIICLPPQWYDAVAYKTSYPVLFGGHGYGFKLLEPTFPRILEPINTLVNRYGVKYILTLEGYLTEKFLHDIKYFKIESIGKCRLFVL